MNPSEFQMVAALVCERMELLYMMAVEKNCSHDTIVGQIKLAVEDMHKWQTDKESRERTFAAAAWLMGLPKGSILSTPLCSERTGE